MVHGRVSLLEIELKVKACFVKQCTFVNIRCRTQGVKHYDAAVVTQLLEFLYRYTSDVLECAQVRPTPCCPTYLLHNASMQLQSHSSATSCARQLSSLAFSLKECMGSTFSGRLLSKL